MLKYRSLVGRQRAKEHADRLGLHVFGSGAGLEPLEPQILLSASTGSPSISPLDLVGDHNAYVIDLAPLIPPNQSSETDAPTLAGESVPPPRVEGVFVSSTEWSQDLLNQLDPTNGLGIAVPTGSGDQLLPLAQNNIDQIVIRFSKDVRVNQNDLMVRGVNVPIHSISGFDYDYQTFTATWTLTAPIKTDKLLLDLSASVQDIQGQALDGEWDNPSGTADPSSSTFGSGDGAAGGYFEFRLNVLPADTTEDGTVNGDDLLTWQASLFDLGANLTADFNFDGTVNGDDLLIWQASLFESLPISNPTLPVLTADLLRDTAPAGLFNSDGITSDAAVIGRMPLGQGAVALRIGLDGMAVGNFVNVTAELGPNGSFLFDQAKLEMIFGVLLSDGAHVLHLRAEDESGESFGTAQIAFTLDTTAPGLAEFALAPASRLLPGSDA